MLWQSSLVVRAILRYTLMAKTKKQIVNEVLGDMDNVIQQRLAEEFVTRLLEHIQRTVLDGGEVEFRTFGRFLPFDRTTPAGQVKNPRTGEVHQKKKKSTRKVGFRAGNQSKKVLT